MGTVALRVTVLTAETIIQRFLAVERAIHQDPVEVILHLVLQEEHTPQVPAAVVIPPAGAQDQMAVLATRILLVLIQTLLRGQGPPKVLLQILPPSLLGALTPLLHRQAEVLVRVLLPPSRQEALTLMLHQTGVHGL